MGTVRVHEFISLDGVYESPSWTAPYGVTPEMVSALAALTDPAQALLLGRVTYEMFAPAWSTRSAEDDPGVAFFNDTTKHVVSGSGIDTGLWQNSVGIGAYDPDAVRTLADAGDVYVSGSGTLVRALLADRLVDELHLFVYPVVLGGGARLFPEGTAQLPLALRAHESYDNGVLHVVLGPTA